MSAPTDTPVSAPAGADRRALLLIYLAVFGGYTGQQLLTPILPPLARAESLSVFQIGVVMSLSAATVAVVSPIWGRRSDTRGRKSLLVTALIICSGALVVFAVTAHAGLAGLLPAALVFVLFAAARGILFGLGLAAIPVAAQSYVAAITPTERDRVRGIARVGAAIGLALVLGPGLGGLLATYGLLPALYAAPVVLLGVAVAVAVALPPEQRAVEVSPRAGRLSPLDRRVLPFLISGLGIYLSVSLLQSSIGFLLQDRLHLDAGRTAQLSGYVLLVGGLPMLLVQGFVIPRLDWSPVRLLRVGVPITATAFVVIALAPNLATMFAGCLLSGIGHSICIPGYNAGPSLRVGADEQGAAAGLLASTTAIILILGPLLATALYQIRPALPFAVGAAALAALFVFLLAGFTRSGDRSAQPT